jgi:transposase
MAFLRVDNKDGEQYIRIVAARRKNGKPLQETVYNLGKVSDYTPDQLKRFGMRFYELGGADPRELLEGSIQELGRYNYGYYQLFSKVLSYYNLDGLFARVARKQHLSFSLTNAVMLMLLERLQQPCSKRQNFYNQQEYLGIEQAELHWLYRSLDYLADNSLQVQQCIYQPSRDLFNQQLDVVFYDVTTFYFDSDVETEGGLRQKGFSKDGKIGNTQILFGLLIDIHKQPIGYRIYKGDSFEGHTFEQALNQLRHQYRIKNIVVVADRGMLSRKNLELTRNNGYEFIIGERLKTLPENIKTQLLNLDNYDKTWTYNEHQEPIVIRYCTIPYQDRTIICTYSQKRADKDRYDREDRLQTASLLLRQPSTLKRKAQHYFLAADSQQQYHIDQQKVKDNERYDGFLAISTNASELSTEMVLDNYRHLYQIEHSFRTFKSHIETRPMFHWTDKRIEGHICLCYIAYTLLTHVQNKLLKSGIRLSEKQIRKALDSMQVSHIKNNDNYFYLRSANGPNVDAIINRMGLKKLPNIVPQQQVSTYLNM